jgi:hypothetical protein
MNRRNFFRLLTGALAAPALAPLAKLLPKPLQYTTYITGNDAFIAKYYDDSGWSNVSYSVRYSIGPAPRNTMRIRHIGIPK